LMPWNNPELAMQPTEQAHTIFGKSHLETCTLAQGLSLQFQNAATAIETLDDELPDDKKMAAVSDMHRQYVYYLVLHEMGHTLGLMHNMKATQMLSPAQMNDVALTQKIGLMGSVMDYPLVNISSDRSKQGDYYTTKCGPYDLWVIEYGYKPFSAAEEKAGLQKILARSTEYGHDFGNDADDMRGSNSGVDPRVNIYDNTNDMVAYGEDRFKLINTMMPKLKDRYSKEGNSYQLLRSRYGQLQSQRAQVAAALSRYIGGVQVDRSFVGQPTSAKPYTPVPADYQKKAMALLGKYIFAPNAFDTDAYLLPYLQVQKRGFSNSEDFKPQAFANTLHMTALSHLLHPNTLTRINNSSLYGNSYSCADVMNDLVKNIMSAD
ncbi:MAG TPA: zinc-dependent metalloprotease, partial [Methylotenera sp.]|nr:zinc-dependent metalloprotease [Methylotenera sp.]